MSFLNQSFEDILYRVHTWINEGSDWIIEKMKGQYLNILSYSPLIGSTYIELPDESKHSKKGLIKIKNDDNKCLLWCHVRHLNCVDKNPQIITKKDKEFVSRLNYEGINFTVSKKEYGKIEVLNEICINILCYERSCLSSLFI